MAPPRRPRSTKTEGGMSRCLISPASHDDVTRGMTLQKGRRVSNDAAHGFRHLYHGSGGKLPGFSRTLRVPPAFAEGEPGDSHPARWQFPLEAVRAVPPRSVRKAPVTTE